MTATTLTAILMSAGAGIFLLLGVAHMVVTVQSDPAAGPMTPTDPVVQAAMVRPGSLGLAPQIEGTLWRAWVGFNLSHALGVIVVAAVVLTRVLADVGAALGEPLFLLIVFAVPPVYLLLSVRYWFRDPTIGITLGGALLWTGALVGLATL